MAQELLRLFMEPINQVWSKFGALIPNVLTSLFFLLIGVTLSRLISSIAENMLRRVKFDEHTSQVGINEIFTRVGFGRSPSYVIGFGIYWTVMLLFITLAANALNLEVVTTLLERFLYFVPKLVVAILVLFGGLLFGNLAHRVVTNSATANNLKGGHTLAKGVYLLIVLFAALAALEQLGIAMVLIISTMQIMLAAIGLAFALALGLGARDLVAQYLKETFGRENKQ